MNQWLILKNRIGSVLSTLKDTLENNKSFDDCRNNINIFLNSYKRGYPNFDILNKLPDDILDKKQKQKFIESFNLKSQLESFYYEDARLSQCKAIINNFINLLYSKYHMLQDKNKKNQNYNSVLKDTITLYEKAYSILSDKGLNEICNEELLNVIIDAITELDIDDALATQMIQELKEKNENLINPSFNKLNSITKENNDEGVVNHHEENGNERKFNDSKEKSTEFDNSNDKNDLNLKNSDENLILKGTKIINEINELIQYFEPILDKYYAINLDRNSYANIYARIEYLKEAINDYNESLKIYINSNQTDDEALNYFYNELNKGYEKLLKEKEKIDINKGTMAIDDDFDIPLDKLKNLIVFIPVDDLEVSNMESELNDDENIRASDYNAIKLALNRLLLGEEEILSTHKAKSENYSETFLKEYHVKSLKTSKCRIMYSRYSTTLKQKYPQLSENPNVVFIFNAGYGLLDGNMKYDLYQKGLQECFKYQNQIDTIRKLLNLDWSKLSEEESEEYDKEIRTLFDLQKKKMDHFFNTCTQVQDLSGKTKPA